jgi:threonine dehydrogenase-like Zn-dependent dehydrogenase
LTGTRTERLELGRRLGADVTIDVTREDVIERVRELTGGQGADVVIECAGTGSSAAAAIEYAKMNGRLAFVGTYTNEPAVSVNARKIALGNLTIAGTRAEGGRSVARAIELLSRSNADISALVTHGFSLSDIHQAFKTSLGRLGGAIKVAVKP